MNIRCFIGLHNWEHYNKNMPIGEAYHIPNNHGPLSMMRMTIHFRYCQRCHKTQRRTNRPAFMSNRWITSTSTEKDHQRNAKLDKILDKIDPKLPRKIT